MPPHPVPGLGAILVPGPVLRPGAVPGLRAVLGLGPGPADGRLS